MRAETRTHRVLLHSTSLGVTAFGQDPREHAVHLFANRVDLDWELEELVDYSICCRAIYPRFMNLFPKHGPSFNNFSAAIIERIGQLPADLPDPEAAIDQVMIDVTGWQPFPRIPVDELLSRAASTKLEIAPALATA